VLGKVDLRVTGCELEQVRACPVASVRDRLRRVGVPVSCAAVPGRQRGGGGWDVAGISWTSWDMIQNLRRADQASSESTDATRTERSFHAARNGVSAAQRLFDGSGWAVCKTVGFAYVGSNPTPATICVNNP
jgi:hypothetical protein